MPQQLSLRNADVESIGGVVTAFEITTSNVLVRPAQLKALGINLRDYDQIRLTLEAKDGVAAMSNQVILEGAFPNP